MNEKHKPYLVALALAIITLSAIAIVYAALPYIQTINWTIASEGFTVDKPTTLNFGVITPPYTTSETYTVTNTGNVPITVTASFSGTGATATWDKTSATIPVSASTTFTATFTVTAAGSGTVTIDKSP